MVMELQLLWKSNNRDADRTSHLAVAKTSTNPRDRPRNHNNQSHERLDDIAEELAFNLAQQRPFVDEDEEDPEGIDFTRTGNEGIINNNDGSEVSSVQDALPSPTPSDLPITTTTQRPHHNHTSSSPSQSTNRHPHPHRRHHRLRQPTNAKYSSSSRSSSSSNMSTNATTTKHHQRS